VRTRGFTLVELAIALLVMAVVLSGLAVPLASQVLARRQDAARHQLEEARDALLGFAALHGRLPCPALGTGGGEERFSAGGGPEDGECADFHGGYLPGATLGLAGLDPQGYARDPWETPANRIRYAVAGTTVEGVARALTRRNGMQLAGLPGLGDAPAYLVVCSTGRDATPSRCGSAATTLSRRAAFVLVSPGANASAGVPAPGSDEARNADGRGLFVAHEPSSAPGNAFDDHVLWLPMPLLASRLVAAGRLP
jgi:prepilin-type N-terminal cleavage/methylation domain-containing protein